jgi:SPP1 gp7 family putative phage head morphogenesis protein
MHKRARNAYADIDAPLPALPMNEAMEFWATKVSLTPKAFYRLAEIYRVRAFTVSRLARADMLEEIYRSIEKALAEGTSFGAWQKSLTHIWEENGWTGVRAWRVDNLFRTNIQTAYNVGRYKQMTAVVKARPYWQYSAVNDSRTRPTHRALHGRVYRHDSPFWDTFYPPNGFRCRCKVKTLSERQLKERGLTVHEGNGLGELIEPEGPQGPMPARPLMPDRGFEGNPGKEAWSPDLSKYPDVLRSKLEKVLP